MKTIQKINLNGLDKERVMSPSEMKHVKGGSTVMCLLDAGGCWNAPTCGDCQMAGGQCYGAGSTC